METIDIWWLFNFIGDIEETIRKWCYCFIILDWEKHSLQVYVDDWHDVSSVPWFTCGIYILGISSNLNFMPITSGIYILGSWSKNSNPIILIIFKILFSIIMSTSNTDVNHFNTTNDEVYVHHMNIQSNNVRFNPMLYAYPEDFNMLVQCLNDSIMAHTLMSSLAIPINWLSLACSTVVCNKQNEIVTFHMESKSTKWQ